MRPKRRPGCFRLTSALFALAVFSATIACAEAPNGYDSVRPLLQRYCYDCHGPDKQKAQIRYDQLTGYANDDKLLWAKVHEQLADREMPPAKHPQPTDAERQAISTWIEQQATAARKSLGAGATRRLNRRELSAALRDVTGLGVDYAASLPGDGKVAGFDTVADGLQDAADSVTEAMKAARRAVDGIRFLDPPPPAPAATEFRDTDNPRRTFEALLNHDPKKGQPGKPKPGSPPVRGMMLEPSWLGDRTKDTCWIPAPIDGKSAVLRLKLSVFVHKAMPGLPNPHLWVEVGGRDIDYHEVTATEDKPEELTYDIQLDDLPTSAKGISLNLSNKIEMPYAIDGIENEDNTKPDDKDKPPDGIGLFHPRIDRKQPMEKWPAPIIIIRRVEIDPTCVAAWPPPAWKADVGTIADNAESAHHLIALWTERAWRRPVATAERERFESLYAKLRTQGLSFDDALRATFQSVLMSSGFRYLSSPADPATGQFAIASRLSFALWGAPPDDELRKLAAANKLRDPATLDAQIDRLLADSRSDAFVRPFVTQWLELDQPITIAMDHIRKMDFRFGRNLKASMRDETIQYVAQLLKDNRPAHELVQSDWTMMNNVLAHRYNYAGVDGGHLRKVTLRPDDPRGGGILGHAGIQSMLCWMGENWVIYRGAWALRHVLDDPPPPPPLEVPELVPSKGENRGKPFKELLKQHQADPNCAVCHTKMDPLGFAFQNFDLAGRWRDVEYETYATKELDGKIQWNGVGKSRPVDCVGQLPRGESFTSFAQCKQLLAKNYRDDLTRGLLKNLVVYTAGRVPDADDLTQIRTIMADLKPKEYPLRDVLKAALRSRIFLDN